MFNIQAKKKKKKAQKKKFETEPSPRQAKPMASPTEQTHPRILKKKKKNQHRIRNQTYPRSRRCREYRENQSPIY